MPHTGYFRRADVDHATAMRLVRYREAIDVAVIMTKQR